LLKKLPQGSFFLRSHRRNVKDTVQRNPRKNAGIQLSRMGSKMGRIHDHQREQATGFGNRQGRHPGYHGDGGGLWLEGKDSLEVRNAAKTANALTQARLMSFDQCAAAYIDAHSSSWKNAKHASQWESTLASYDEKYARTIPNNQVATAKFICRVSGDGWCPVSCAEPAGA
jgi:hypothetical protein